MPPNSQGLITIPADAIEEVRPFTVDILEDLRGPVTDPGPLAGLSASAHFVS